MAPLVFIEQSATQWVVWKPAGLASELPRGHDAESVLTLVAAQLPDATPKLPHRLDRVTCGILLVCLTAEAIAFHNAQIKARRWEKHYLAEVVAKPASAPGSLIGQHRAFLSETSTRAKVVRSGGKPAWLEIVAAAPTPARADRWHLLIRLMTGRFHQIRVMCEALGVPLPGDPLYDPAGHDASQFYLEHVVLKYEHFDTRDRATVYVPGVEGRPRLAPSMQRALDEIVVAPARFEVSA